LRKFIHGKTYKILVCYIGGGEITFEIDGKEEKFAFKPRPELNINVNMIDQEKTSSEGPLSPKMEDAPKY
jgi:hypothetical protein